MRRDFDEEARAVFAPPPRHPHPPRTAGHPSRDCAGHGDGRCCGLRDVRLPGRGAGGEGMSKKPETTRLSKRHTQYLTADGTLVPGVTTITGQMDKPALAFAANRLGLQGIDSGVHWKGLAAIGTL